MQSLGTRVRSIGAASSGRLLAPRPGPVLDLHRKIGEAIDIYVKDRLVAPAEVVLDEAELGLTITEIIEAERVTRGPHRKDRAMRLLIVETLGGNVRELENTMHRAVLLASGPEIGLDALRGLDGGTPAAHADDPAAHAALAAEVAARALVGSTVADVERNLIIETLTHCLGNRTHAANILGISIRTLRNKLNQYTVEGFSVPPPTPGYGNAA